MNTRWHFVKHQLGQPLVNPLGGEHFSEADDDWKPGEVLVRECIQNSLDARHSDEPVIVKFQVFGSPAMPEVAANFWFATLWPHLRSGDCKLPDLPERPSSGGFVVVEDFGTQGLEGDVRQGGLGDADNRFFNFFRAEGLSGNPMNGTSGGSWGVGKSVFNRCSQINTTLALTVRRRSSDTALLGKSLLWQHRISAEEFQGLGQFGAKEPQNEFLVLPVVDRECVQRFVSDFHLSRRFDGQVPEPGLSVVIPYADPDISAEGIEEIVIREYFHPIISGRLIVQIGELVAGRRRVRELSSGTLLDHAARLRRPEVTRVLELARWSLAQGAEGPYELDRPVTGGPPVWRESLLRGQDPRFKALCEQFERGERVAIRVPLEVKRPGRSAEAASFDVYLQRDMIGTGYRPVFVRGSIVVPNARQRAVRNQSMFSLICIGEGPLAVMLRAAEPPAHTFWSPDTANFKGRYEFGKQVIDFVVAAPKFLADALSNARTERDVDVWADLFPSPVSDGDRDAQGNKRQGKRINRPPIEPPPSRLRAFRVDESSGGFAITRSHVEQTELPEGIRVIAAYDTSRGNPFKRYRVADFDVAKLKVDVVGADVLERKENRLLIRLTSERFHVAVSGFDTNRDLVIHASAAQIRKEVDE
jgi:hypothetical protein